MTNRILIIVTNADEYEKVGFRTGLWLSELTHFWDVAERSGYQLDIASPSGGKVPIDPESLIMTEVGDAVGIRGAVLERYADRAFMNRLGNSLDASTLDAADYDAIYLTGGHGVMFDFPTSAPLARLIADFYVSDKIVSAVCHGPAGLLEVKLDDGRYLLEGKKVTGFSWKEEELAKRDQAVPYSLEDELRKRGAHYTKATIPFASYVVEDGRLVTGQNPRSAHAVGEAVVRMLRALKPKPSAEPAHSPA
jgi:putative intracellular protease/amidase